MKLEKREVFNGLSDNYENSALIPYQKSAAIVSFVLRQGFTMK
jgi:hypothetical protein